MPTQLFVNNFSTSLSASALSTDTILYLTSVVGLPDISSSDSFSLTIKRGTSAAVEIVNVSSIDIPGKSVTVIRGSESTTALSFNAGDIVEMRVTAHSLSNHPIYDTVADMVASVGTRIGQFIGVKDYATGNNSGFLFFKAVAAGTGVADGGEYIDSVGVPAVQFQQNFPAIITFKMYGAAGDGATNDASAIYNAINNSSNRIIDGDGGTYRLDTASILTSENITIQNAVFDISNIPDQGGSPDWIMTFSGTQGAATNLTADALKGVSVLAVTDSTGFSVDAYAWLSSSAVFESTASVSLGHIVKVKSIDSSTQVTLYDDVLYDFNTADTAQLSPLTTKKNIALHNVRVIGSGANNQSAFYFDKCEDVTVENSDFEFCHYAAATFSRCINFNVNNNTVRYARSTGLSYGFPVLNGCYGGRIQNGYGEDMRHYVTVGGSNGVNVFTTVAGNHIKSTKDGGIDAHPACDFMTIVGNTVEGASTDSGGHDGIIFQGLNCVITGNTIVGARRYSIMAQHLPDIGTGSCVIADNLIANSGDSASTDAGIQVTAEGTSINLDGVSITGNVIKGTNEYGIYVYGLSGSMENVNISNNTANGMTSRGIFVNCNPAYTIDRLVISTNILEGSGGEGIYLLGETTNNITNASITGNIVDGFTFGLRTIKVDEMTETGNIFKNYSDPYEISTDSTNIRLDTRNYSAFTVTNATFSLEEHNDWIVCNRAATITLTLRSAATYPGKVINIKTIQAQSVISSASDIVPIGDSVAGTAILPAVDGAWVVLRSDGVNWVVMQQG